MRYDTMVELLLYMCIKNEQDCSKKLICKLKVTESGLHQYPNLLICLKLKCNLQLKQIYGFSLAYVAAYNRNNYSRLNNL